MKHAVKNAAIALAMLAVAPVWLAYRIGATLLGSRRVFPGYSQLMSLPPGLIGQYVRWAFYRLILPRCGADAHIGFATVFSHPTAEIGPLVYVGPFCVVGDVTIEADALVGSNVSLINGSRQHGIERLDVPVREQPGEYPRVTIGRDAWIGDRAIVMADVGRHAVVGAGSVVTKPVADYAIVAGNPAKVIGRRGDGGPSAIDSTPPKVRVADGA